MKLLLTCAIVALCVFAQIVRAQDDDVEEPVHTEGAKHQEDEEVKLDSRGSLYGGSRGRGLLNGLGSSRRRSRGGRRNSLLFGEGGNSLGLGGLRGNRGLGNLGGLGNFRGAGNGRGIDNGNGAIIQNLGVTNKVVRGYTEILPTKETHSVERHDVRSQSDSYFRQNSASTVTQNNKRKQTFIHTHLNQVVYHPRHVNHIHKHHHTTFIKQLFPEVKKVYISQKQKIVEPEKLTIVKYTQDSSFENKVFPTQVQRLAKNERLRTIEKPVRNLGVKNIGSPLAVNVNGGVGGGGAGFETGNRGLSGISGNNNGLLNNGGLLNDGLLKGGSVLIEEGGRRRVGGNGSGVYGNNAYSLSRRNGEDVKEEVEVAIQAQPAEAAAETTVDVKAIEAPANILEQRSASIQKA